MNREQLINKIFNNGERLIPFITHDNDEVIRHFTSYKFFADIIKIDINCESLSNVSVLDVGFGCGYGCFIYSNIDQIDDVIGIDIEPACKQYALETYPANNIKLVISDAQQYVSDMQQVTYVTSRGVLQRIRNGISLAAKFKYSRRLIFDVPYDEKNGNNHEVLLGIKEDVSTFPGNCELFYEGIDGTIYDSLDSAQNVNMIMCVVSAENLQPVRQMFSFPVKPISLEYIRDVMLCRMDTTNNRRLRSTFYYYDESTNFLENVRASILTQDTVLDVGTGIVPMNYFRPKLHIMLEPYDDYIRILQNRHADDKSIFIIQGMAQDILRYFTDNSIDSVFMLDLVEHLPKEVGYEVLKHAERIARRQVIVFTPLGFMPQHVHCDEKDGWGLSGAALQEHLSGWQPKDFGEGWEFHICKNFHLLDFRKVPLEKPHGAFFAIRTFRDKPLPKAETLSDIRRPLPSEIELADVRSQLAHVLSQLDNNRTNLIQAESELADVRSQLATATRIINHPIIRAQRRIWRMLRHGSWF